MIRDLTAAFARQDVSRIEEWAHPDVVFDWSRSMNDIRGVYRGVEGLQQAFDRFFEAWAEVTWEVTEMEELGGDRLLATTRFAGRGRESGIEIDARGAQVWEYRDQKLIRVTMYQDRDQAVAALAEEHAD